MKQFRRIKRQPNKMDIQNHLGNGANTEIQHLKTI